MNWYKKVGAVPANQTMPIFAAETESVADTENTEHYIAFCFSEAKAE